MVRLIDGILVVSYFNDETFIDMKLDSELRTLLYLRKSLENDFPSDRSLLVLKIVMATLIMVCVITFMFAISGKLSAAIAVPLAAVSGLFVGYISYYIRSIEIWPHYRPHISKTSVEDRINEIDK